MSSTSTESLRLANTKLRAGLARLQPELNSAAVTPDPDGTATATLRVGGLPAAERVTIDAAAPHQGCRAIFDPARGQPVLSCRSTS